MKRREFLCLYSEDDNRLSKSLDEFFIDNPHPDLLDHFKEVEDFTHRPTSGRCMSYLEHPDLDYSEALDVEGWQELEQLDDDT